MFWSNQAINIIVTVLFSIGSATTGIVGFPTLKLEMEDRART